MRRILLVSALLLSAGVSPAPAQEFFFKDHDRVVMIGDSITEQHMYSNYVEMWVVTRFPAWDITFRNTGIGGDRSPGGNSRFARDVASYKPTAMTVDFGMNDGGYRAFDTGGFKTYMDGLQGMAEQAKKANIRVAWVTPQPLDYPSQGPNALTDYNPTLEKYSAGVKEIAQKNGGLFVDQFHPYLAVLDKARQAEKDYGRITGGDPVHPGPPGQALMAASILKGLHFPAAVSSMTINLTANMPYHNGGCKITDFASTGQGVKFTRLDEALPFFPEDAKSILKWAPLLAEMNEYPLKITGLSAGKYAVRIDGTKVAEYTAEELAKGVNMAEALLAAGPIADQVRAVRKAVEAKNGYHHGYIFRGIVLNPASIPDWLGISLTAKEIEAKKQAAIAERLEKLKEYDAAVKKSLEMKPHVWEVARGN